MSQDLILDIFLFVVMLVLIFRVFFLQNKLRQLQERCYEDKANLLIWAATLRKTQDLCEMLKDKNEKLQVQLVELFNVHKDFSDRVAERGSNAEWQS